jgi:hypothetical protein
VPEAGFFGVRSNIFFSWFLSSMYGTTKGYQINKNIICK